MDPICTSTYQSFSNLGVTTPDVENYKKYNKRVFTINIPKIIQNTLFLLTPRNHLFAFLILTVKHLRRKEVVQQFAVKVLLYGILSIRL